MITKDDPHQILQLQHYVRLNNYRKEGQIVFAGSSLMEFFPINELLQSLDLPYCIYNRGIAGYVSEQLLRNIRPLILDLKPSQLFINIGSNDIGQNRIPELLENYREILGQVKKECPDCRITVMAYYPCNHLDDFGAAEAEHEKTFLYRTPEAISQANTLVRQLAEEMGCRYVDVNAGLADERGVMKKEICEDGVHMYPDGYYQVLQNLLPYLRD